MLRPRRDVGSDRRAAHARGPRVLAATLALLTCCALTTSQLDDKCVLKKRGELVGKLKVIQAEMKPSQQTLHIPIFPNGTGLSVAGVEARACGAGAGRVRLRVSRGALAAERVRARAALRLRLKVYVVPYAVGRPQLTDGDLHD